MSARARFTAFVLAPVLAFTAVGLGVIGATSATAAPVPPPTATIALQDGATQHDADPKPFILAGEDATFDVSLTNTSPTTPGYNTAFVLTLPMGVAFVSAGEMGAPVVYTEGQTLPNSAKSAATPPAPLAVVPAGQQVWVFEDVSDLPATASYTGSITVRPDADVFPVGAEPTFTVSGYISSQPQLKPIFDGSTGVSGQAGLLETSSGDASDSMPVQAVRLTKAEPSPEIELLRGVHDNQTTYTLTVENTPQGATTGVTVVDWIPAGLEFLGCADVDNTRPSDLLYDGSGATGGTLEYPGSGSIDTGLLAGDPDCYGAATLVSVETVNTGIPADLEPGVYTKVTWSLPPLTGETPQAGDLSAAGVPGITTIRYAAAVPLFENTMDFVTADGSGTPAVDGAQGANLNNNNGPSTRQGQGEGYGDGILYRNSAAVTGTYAGVATSDTDTEDIQAMDLRILKSVDTGAGNDFVTGGLATFTLTLDASEYAGAENLVITDTMPNGLCPAVPGLAAVGSQIPQECLDAATGTVTGATVLDGSTYDSATGEFTLRLAVADIPAGESATITYPVLMRADYDTDGSISGPTSSGDALTNVVEYQGGSVAIADIADVENAAGAPAGADETIFDDSSAEIVSTYSQIEKNVLPRGSVIDTAPAAPTAGEACDVQTGWTPNQTADGDTAFHIGDVVCFQLIVDYAQQIDVRNPVVTDFLPSGIEYVDWAIGDRTTFSAAQIQPNGAFGQRMQWLIGAPDIDNDRIVELGSTLELLVLGRVTSLTPNSDPTQDKPENLMKYQQENVDGDVYFLRDSSAIKTAFGPSLVKGVRDINGGPQNPFGSNVDNVPVQGGDAATFRIDLTIGDNPVVDLTVWDMLPAGITADDIEAISDGGVALDPTDAGYPANVQDETRSVILWSGLAYDAAEEASLLYTVDVPADVLAASTFVNTASITQYGVELNTGETGTFYPTGTVDTTDRPEDQQVPGAGSTDTSSIRTNAPSVTKTVLRSEISPETNAVDPNNTRVDAAAGEIVTWEYSVTIPAETSVANAVLRDRGLLNPGGIRITEVSATATGPLTPDFSLQTSPSTGPDAGYVGVLRFPDVYTNSTTSPQTFAVQLTGYVPPAAAETLNNNQQLDNTAEFDSGTWDGTATTSVRYVEPTPTIIKTASPDENVEIGEPVRYSITVVNSANRVTLWDSTVVDTIPAGLLVDPARFQPQPVSFDPGVITGDGGTITWNIGNLGYDRFAEVITYWATIEPGTGGGTTYRNEAELTGYTLPADLGGEDTTGRRAPITRETSATIEAVTADIQKGVRFDAAQPFAPTGSAPIGDRAEYEVTVSLAPNINYYDVRVVDTLPAGVTPASVQSAPVVSPAGSVAGGWQQSYDAAANTLTWTLLGSGDIPFAAEGRTLTFSYEADLTNAVPSNVNALTNTAEFSWNRVNNQPGTRDDVDDDATVTVLNPALAIDKSVTDTTPGPGEIFSYTVRVTNTGNTPAYNTVVTDDIPAGVVVDPSTITGGGVLSGSTITWDATDLPGPLYQADAGDPTEYVFTYVARLAPSATLGTAALTNTASVDSYESFPTGGREYTGPSDTAAVTPEFPFVQLQKAATDGPLAYVGDPYTWTLTLTNTGQAPAQTVDATDILPPNWTYDSGSARVSIGGAPAAQREPVITVNPAGDELVWEFGAAAPEAPVLPGAATAGAPARTITVVFTATPDADAIDTPGLDAPHVNTLTATTTDRTGATGNASGAYTGPDATAETRIDEADVAIEKVAASTPLVAGGTAAEAWTITVTNNGPDTAVGPFTVTDDWGVLPAGFTVTGFSGDGWSCLPASDGFSCERTNAADTLAEGASFPPIVVSAQVAASFAPADAPVSNTAEVTARTYDGDETDNTSTDEVEVSFSADLVMTKTGPATAPNAGESLTWILTVRNDGLADSRSVAGDLITVTDEIPEGVEDVIALAPPGWTVSGPGPFQPGDTVTFTLPAGTVIADGASVEFFLTGVIDPSIAPGAEIENAATVNPGATTDPDLDNNTDEVGVDPTTDTTIDVSKVRVVLVDGAWVPATQPVTAGDPVSYLVTVANTGTADARGVSVLDEVEDYLTYTALAGVDGSWTRVAGPQGPGDDQTFTLGGILAPRADASFVATFTVSPAWTGEVENLVVASAENAPDDEASTESGSTRSVDLEMVKSHTQAQTLAGESLEYTLTVTNRGPSDTQGPIVVTDTLPAGFSYDAGSARYTFNGGPSIPLEPAVDGQDLVWTLGTAASALPVNGQIVVTLTADVAADVLTGTYTNVAEVNGPDADPNPGNDRDEDPTAVVTRADLSLEKSVAAGPYIAGQGTVYTVTVVNDGPSVARGVTVTDILPAGLTATSISGAGWTCDLDTVACSRDVLPLGSSDITIEVDIAANVLTGTVLENVATVTSPTDPDPSDNTDEAEITVITEADLSVVKTAVDADGEPITTIVAGTELRYLFEVANAGASDAVGPITLTDTLPAGFTFVSIAEGGAGWTATVDPADAQTVTFTSAAGLAAGASTVDLVIVVAVDASQPLGAAENTVVVSSPTPDPVPENNTDESVVDVEQEIDLAIVKSHDAADVKVGEEVVFDLAVENAGPSTATAVTVVDTIPAGLEYVDAGDTDPAWTVVADATADDGTTTVTATLADPLLPGALAPTLQIAVLVLPEAYAIGVDHAVTNTATVTAEQPDTDPENDTSDDVVTVPALSSLTVTKTAVGAFQAGSNATYRITVANAGPTADPGPITITDTLPGSMRFVSAAGDDVGCVSTGATVTCTIDGALAVGASVTVTLVVALQRGAFPEVTNAVTVTTPTEQVPGRGALTASVTTPVAADPLAATGANPVTGIAILAALLLIAGILLLIARRRRPHIA